MKLNSVNTNIGAMTALQSLNRTNDALGVVQKRISTGFRVADAKDDGGAFAVAQSVRGDVAGLTAANEQLGGLKGIIDVTLHGLKQVSSTMVELRMVLTALRMARSTLNSAISIINNMKSCARKWNASLTMRPIMVARC